MNGRDFLSQYEKRLREEAEKKKECGGRKNENGRIVCANVEEVYRLRDIAGEYLKYVYTGNC